MTDLLFEKEEGNWYVVLSDYAGPKSDLLMVAGADKLLDDLDEDLGTVSLTVSTIKFNDRDLTLTKMFNAHGGAVYFVTSRLLSARPIWLCKVVKFVFDQKIPRKLYVRVNDQTGT